MEPTPPASTGLPQRFRQTPRGQVRARAPARSTSHAALSAHLHDLLQMCGDGIAMDQLRQFMPPRTLHESLQTLMALGLVEAVPQPAAQFAVA